MSRILVRAMKTEEDISKILPGIYSLALARQIFVPNVIEKITGLSLQVSCTHISCVLILSQLLINCVYAEQWLKFSVL